MTDPDSDLICSEPALVGGRLDLTDRPWVDSGALLHAAARGADEVVAHVDERGVAQRGGLDRVLGEKYAANAEQVSRRFPERVATYLGGDFGDT
jgi:hypothetical protein